MAPIAAASVILHAFPYGETSKIIRLLTREHGLLSAIAKGAHRPNSRFGARLQVMSEGVAQIYLKAGRDLHTLAEFDVTEQHAGLSREVSRYASAAALCEVVLRLSPAEPHDEIYDLVIGGLGRLDTLASSDLQVASLALLWSVVAVLGFTPRSDACARDGRALPAGAVTFSVTEGGFLCARCAETVSMTVLEGSDRATLERLIAGDVTGLQPLAPRHAAAHRRLLVRFVERHVAEGRELRALEFWQEQA